MVVRLATVLRRQKQLCFLIVTAKSSLFCYQCGCQPRIGPPPGKEIVVFTFYYTIHDLLTFSVVVRLASGLQRQTNQKLIFDCQI